MDNNVETIENSMIRFYKDEFRKKQQNFRKKQYLSQSLRNTKNSKNNKKIRKRGSLDNDINNTETILSQARKIKSSENLTTDAFGFEFYYMKKAREKRDALYDKRRADLHAKLAKKHTDILNSTPKIYKMS